MNTVKPYLLCFMLFGTLISCAQESDNSTTMDEQKSTIDESKLETVTLGAGCFWCIEAVFEELKGVYSVTSGYAGGTVPNPSYRAVCTGTTGHAEVAQIQFDPEELSFDELLEVFWKTHDPTTLNRQGADVGTQYRSAVFYHDEEQKEAAEKYKQRLNELGAWDDPVITEISPLTVFYEADESHQDYYKNNSNDRYCSYVIQPKLDKFRKAFADKLKN
ncbi:MAG: peptide-methionine (S)-S-oxide reductase MsrA [Bacteroidetes bacterium]|nr:peptide-methionine (S)-S-oxide reductase MsrA [Bacteroidota bacterium]